MNSESRWGRLARMWVALVFMAGLPAAAARVPWNTSKIQGSPEPPPLGRVERVFPRLEFKSPVQILWEPQTGRYWVLEVGGGLYSFLPQPDPEKADLAGHLARTRDGQPRPMKQALSLAFHPGFTTNRFVYVAYQTGDATPDGSRVSRFRLTDAASPELDINSELPLIFWRGGGHNGCSLNFGPDGMLYISTGDAEAPEPPDRLKTGQDISDLLSSILRIDVDHPGGGLNYAVPADNPFVRRAGARPEVWAYGFRNPWRTSFGPDGALWVGDVGWEMWEMIHRVTSGYNGGWSRMEGPQSVAADILPPTPISAPAAAHPHSEAASITGGEFYQGRRFPELAKSYIYGDWETGKIWALWHDGTRTTRLQELCDTTLKIVDFASAAGGEMLVLDHQEGKASGIYQLVRHEGVNTAARFPRRLSETGLFVDVASERMSAGVVEYRPVATQWADHATSQRWLALPGETRVTTARGHPWAEISWAFPSNAVLAKTLSIEMIAGNSGSRRKLETQILHQDGQTWQAYTYRWNELQTDAELVPAEGEATVLKIRDAAAPDGIREQPWRFHSRTECLRCHNFWPGSALAFGWDSLAGKPMNGGAATEMARLVELDVLRETRPNEKPYPALCDPADGTATLEARARAWLNVNCAHCHRFGAGGVVAAYFNADLPLKDLRILDAPPSRGTFGLPDARILAPGDPWRSVLLFRAASTGAGHMPAIGSRQRDEAGLALLRDWITSLSPTTNSPVTAGVRKAADQLGAAPAGPGRAQTMREMFTNSAVALALLDRSATDAGLREDFIQAARSHPNSAVRDLTRHLLRPDQIQPVLGDEFAPAQVLSLQGDVERGRSLFHQEAGPGCARCHLSEGRGRSFGPDLTAIARKLDRTALLQHIVQPSLLVAPEFVLHLVEMRDGTSWSGFLARTNAQQLTLVTEAGEQAISRADVLKLDQTSQSAMPEGLLAPLTALEAADLLAYLSRGP